MTGERGTRIGPAGEHWGQERPAGGVVPTLARRVCRAISADSATRTLLTTRPLGPV